MTYVKYITIALSLVMCTALIGQEEGTPVLETVETDSTVSASLALIAKSGSKSIKLRWAPTTAMHWLYGNKYGYILQRKKLAINEGTVPAVGPTELLTGDTIKPWPLDDWKVFADTGNDLPLVAAQAIYGEQTVIPSLENIVKADDELQNKYGFALLAADQSQDCALASGLYYEDTDIEEGYMYKYTLYLGLSPSEEADTVVVFSSPVLEDVATAPDIIEVGEVENSITLKWLKSDDATYSGYFIERSADGGNTFAPLNDRAYVMMQSEINKGLPYVVYQDSLVENYKPYTYRVRGIDAFAELGPWSTYVTAMGRDKTPVSPPRDIETEQTENNGAMITWSWEAEDGEKDLAGFDIYHSNDPQGYFAKRNTTLLPKGSREYVDDTISPIESNYYYVAAIDTAGNVSKSLRRYVLLVDSIAPAPPTGLAADIDSNGLINLRWDLGPEIDLTSYQVYFSNDKNEVFTNRSKDYVRDTTYQDSVTLQTLTEEIYYYVVAFDASFNESERSEIITVKKPDIVPPVAAIFADYKNSDNAIFIKFIPSSSVDVVAHILERKTDGTPWKEVEQLAPGTSQYTDTTVEDGEFYEYRLIAVDDSGNKTTSSKNLRLRASGPLFLQTPTSLLAKRKGDKVELSWEYANTEDIYFLLYRKVGDDPLLSYQRVDGQQGYTDVAIDKEVSYALKAVHKNGKESEVTDLVPAN